MYNSLITQNVLACVAEVDGVSVLLLVECKCALLSCFTIQLMYGLRDCLVDRRCCLYETKSLNDLAHSPSKYVFYESLALFFELSAISPMFLYLRF